MARQITDKIAKILAKAQGTDNEHEAEMLMAKVHELLELHNLKICDVDAEHNNDPIASDSDIVSCFKASYWIVTFTGALAKYYGCESMYTQVGNKFLFGITGRLSSRETFRLMHPFVVKQVRKQAALKVMEGYYSSKSKAERAIGNALTSRLWRECVRNQRKDEARVAGGLNALVPVDLIKSRQEIDYPGLIDARSMPKRTDYIAQTTANKIPINLQAGKSDTRKLT